MKFYTQITDIMYNEKHSWKYKLMGVGYLDPERIWISTA